MSTSNKHYPRCLAPWQVQYFGFDYYGCCTCLNGRLGESKEKMFNSPELKEVRKNMFNDNISELPQICRECVNSKTSMAEFYRQDFHKEHFDDVIQYFDPDTGHMSKKELSQFIFPISNKCNQSCRMCSSACSHIFAKAALELDLGSKDPQGRIHLKNKDFMDDYKAQLPYLKEISFHGGEAILNPEMPELLRLALPYKDNINILFMTNGMVDKFTDGSSLSDWANKFPKFSIPYSIDGDIKINEYVRQGAKTKRIYENLKKFKRAAPHSILTIRHTTSNYNVEFLPEFLKTVDDYSDGLYDALMTDKVISPSKFSPCNIPPEKKREIMTKLIQYTKEETDPHKIHLAQLNISYLFMRPFDPEVWNDFVEESKKVDGYWKVEHPSGLY